MFTFMSNSTIVISNNYDENYTYFKPEWWYKNTKIWQGIQFQRTILDLLTRNTW